MEAIKAEVMWQLLSKTSQYDFHLNTFSLTFFKALSFFLNYTLNFSSPYALDSSLFMPQSWKDIYIKIWKNIPAMLFICILFIYQGIRWLSLSIIQ